MAASEETLTVKYSSSLLNTQILIQNNKDVLDAETNDVEIENVTERVTFTCEPCKKVYLTKGGFNRHVRRVHQTAHIKLNDADLEALFLESITELSLDPCYVTEQQMAWKNMKFVPDSPLFASIQSTYEKMKSHVNAQKYYTDYTQIIMNITSPFPGLDFMSTIELLRKTGDKILAHFQKSFRNMGNSTDEVVITQLDKNEMEALEYLGGYVVYNVEKKLKRKSNSRKYLEVLCCFESEDVSDQVIVNLLNRGGLRGIQNTTKNIFIKTEHEFRKHTRGNFQNIDIFEITKTLLNDLEVTGNMFMATDNIMDLKEEIVSNVVESMIIVYLRVRSFSCVRDLVTQKKMEKDVALKEKALRKTLKKNTDKSKKMEE
jgi:galactitol-specific phosphotransferase system IIB component